MPNPSAVPVKLPAGSKVEVVFVRLPDGRLVPRSPDELIKQPIAPPASE